MRRLKSYLTPCAMTAIVIYILTCAALFAVEYIIYRGAIGTVFSYALVTPPLAVLVYSLFGVREPSQNHKKSTGMLALASGGVVAAYFIFNTDHLLRLTSWQMLAALFAVGIVYILERLLGIKPIARLAAVAVILVYSALLASTALFLGITRPVTADTAKQILMDSGYQNPSFVTHCPAGPDSDFLTDKPEYLGAYSFFNVTDSRNVYVDVATGEIIK